MAVGRLARACVASAAVARPAPAVAATVAAGAGDSVVVGSASAVAGLAVCIRALGRACGRRVAIGRRRASASPGCMRHVHVEHGRGVGQSPSRAPARRPRGHTQIGGIPGWLGLGAGVSMFMGGGMHACVCVECRVAQDGMEEVTEVRCALGDWPRAGWRTGGSSLRRRFVSVETTLAQRSQQHRSAGSARDGQTIAQQYRRPPPTRAAHRLLR